QAFLFIVLGICVAAFIVGCDDKIEEPIEEIKITEGLQFLPSADDKYYFVTGVEDKDIEELYIPSVYGGKPVRGIDVRAFEGLSLLKKIYLGDNVETIGAFAFAYCPALEEISVSEKNRNYVAKENCLIERSQKMLVLGCSTSVIPDDGSVTTIGSGAFAGSSITELIIPDGVTALRGTIISRCENLTKLVLPKTLSTVNPLALREAGVKEIVTPLNVISYLNKNSIEKLTIIDGVNVPQNAFSSFQSLKSVTLPDTMKTIDEAAFKDCAELTEIDLGKNLTTIGDSAFYGCSSLKNVSLPASIESIGTDAFFGCNSLNYNEYGNAYYLGRVDNPILCLVKADPASENFEVLSPTKLICGKAFEECGCTSIIIPETVLNLDTEIFSYCRNLIEITVSEKNPNYYSREGILFSKITDAILYIPIDTHGRLVLPDSIRYIDDQAFSGRSEITEVVIPDSVSTIGQNAFTGCTELRKVTLGKALTDIKDYAFLGCSKLESIEIPDTLTTLGRDVFDGCDGLIYNEYGGANYLGNEANPYLALVCVKGGTSYLDINTRTKVVADYLLLGNEEVETLIIPDGLDLIGSGAFESDSLISVTLPVRHLTLSNFFSVRTFIITSGDKIGDYEFYTRSNVENVVLPDTVTSIGMRAFSDCSSLKSVEFSNSVVDIGTYAFYDCASLKSVFLPSSLETIGANAFYGCASLESVEFSNSVVDIGIYAFYGCTSLESVFLPSSLETIGASTFYGCASLESVFLPSSLKTIGANAFYDCTSLKSVSLPLSLETIGSGAFYGCKNITDLTIPSNDLSFGLNCFLSCTGLKNVYFEGTIVDWIDLSFTSFYSNPTVRAENLYFNGELVSDLVIPEGVERISNYAFMEYKNLKSVTFPETLTSIGDYAFYKCMELTNLALPSSLVSIGSYAFSNCLKLEKVVIPVSVKKIQSGAFIGDAELFYEGTEGQLAAADFSEKIKYTYSVNQPTKEGNFWHYDEEGNIAIWEKQEGPTDPPQVIAGDEPEGTIEPLPVYGVELYFYV
ncbi:MAG: leucine-rich repeat protein, partial [Clostridia bacterium]|nr:leucine-rich repeat protein [Clostridia bacterium]